MSQHTTSSAIMYARSFYYTNKRNEPASDSTLKYMSVYILSEQIPIGLSDPSSATYLCTAASVVTHNF